MTTGVGRGGEARLGATGVRRVREPSFVDALKRCSGARDMSDLRCAGGWAEPSAVCQCAEIRGLPPRGGAGISGMRGSRPLLALAAGRTSLVRPWWVANPGRLAS